MDRKYSVIIPVFNRPQEIKELLESLTQQTNQDFEVVVVEDGSTTRSENIVDEYRERLKIQYVYKPNTGPGPSRNAGVRHARGQYVVFFDSDCILPSNYFESVDKHLNEINLDTWGGPDKPHDDFTLMQRAMGYTMSSVLTTGGIRGGKKKLGWFQPRSFNMGVARSVFETTGGFKFDRYAEDIEFSIRMKKAGFKIGLISEAFVYHKRRTDFSQFYQQVFNFGKGRALVGKLYPDEIKLTHWFPTIFTLGVISLFALPLINVQLFAIAFAAFLLFLLVIFFHSLIVNKSLAVAILSVPSALLQFFGYGIGFLQERLKPYSGKTPL